MDPIKAIRSKLLPLPARDINTDTVTPVRFLKMTGRDTERLKLALFHDWRFGPDGAPKPDFAMNRPEHQGARVLLVGDNFGCGSSREKAPWAVVAHGFQAVISTSIADIFRSNALKNGLLPIIVDAASHQELFDLVAKDPSLEVTIDLEQQTLSWPPGRTVRFPIDPFSRTCLLKGVDELGYLLGHEEAISRYEREREKQTA